MTKKTSDRESNNLATLPEQGRKRQKEKRMAKKKKKTKIQMKTMQDKGKPEDQFHPIPRD